MSEQAAPVTPGQTPPRPGPAYRPGPPGGVPRPGPVTAPTVPAAPATEAMGSEAEGSEAAAGSVGGTEPEAAVVPGDPVQRALAAVEGAMAEVRGVSSHGDGTPTVPGDDEVAALERAHETLRTTLDRVDRSG